jgi:hypothetical protein
MRAASLLESYSEPLHPPGADGARAGRDYQPGEVNAVVTLLDRLPQLAEAMDYQVIPLRGHLHSGAPT